MDNQVSMFDIFLYNFPEIANYYKLLIEKELQDVQKKLKFKAPSEGMKLLYEEIQKTSSYLENGIVYNLYSLFDQSLTVLETQANSFEAIRKTFPAIKVEDIPGFPYTVKFFNNVLKDNEISSDDYNQYMEEIRNVPGSDSLLDAFQADNIHHLAHYIIHIKYQDFYRIQLKNLLWMRYKAQHKNEVKTKEKEEPPKTSFTLENIIINENKLAYLEKELTYKGYIAKDTRKWINKEKGKQIRIAALMQVLYQKGYTRRLYEDKELVEIIKTCFDVTIGERTLRKYLEIQSVMKEFEFIKPADKLM